MKRKNIPITITPIKEDVDLAFATPFKVEDDYFVRLLTKAGDYLIREEEGFYYLLFAYVYYKDGVIREMGVLPTKEMQKVPLAALSKYLSSGNVHVDGIDYPLENLIYPTTSEHSLSAKLRYRNSKCYTLDEILKDRPAIKEDVILSFAHPDKNYLISLLTNVGDYLIREDKNFYDLFFAYAYNENGVLQTKEINHWNPLNSDHISGCLSSGILTRGRVHYPLLNLIYPSEQECSSSRLRYKNPICYTRNRTLKDIDTETLANILNILCPPCPGLLGWRIRYLDAGAIIQGEFFSLGINELWNKLNNFFKELSIENAPEFIQYTGVIKVKASGFKDAILEDIDRLEKIINFIREKPSSPNSPRDKTLAKLENIYHEVRKNYRILAQIGRTSNSGTNPYSGGITSLSHDTLKLIGYFASGAKNKATVDRTYDGFVKNKISTTKPNM